MEEEKAPKDAILRKILRGGHRTSGEKNEKLQRDFSDSAGQVVRRRRDANRRGENQHEK